MHKTLHLWLRTDRDCHYYIYKPPKQIQLRNGHPSSLEIPVQRRARRRHFRTNNQSSAESAAAGQTSRGGLCFWSGRLFGPSGRHGTRAALWKRERSPRGSTKRKTTTDKWWPEFQDILEDAGGRFPAGAGASAATRIKEMDLKGAAEGGSGCAERAEPELD